MIAWIKKKKKKLELDNEKRNNDIRRKWMFRFDLNKNKKLNNRTIKSRGLNLKTTLLTTWLNQATYKFKFFVKKKAPKN